MLPPVPVQVSMKRVERRKTNEVKSRVKLRTQEETTGVDRTGTKTKAITIINGNDGGGDKYEIRIERREVTTGTRTGFYETRRP